MTLNHPESSKPASAVTAPSTSSNTDSDDDSSWQQTFAQLFLRTLSNPHELFGLFRCCGSRCCCWCRSYGSSRRRQRRTHLTGRHWWHVPGMSAGSCTLLVLCPLRCSAYTGQWRLRLRLRQSGRFLCDDAVQSLCCCAQFGILNEN